MASVFLPPASYLRKTFAIPKPVHRAQLYTSTLGAADFYINGKRLQQNTIPLLWTNFQKQVYNRVFDVTDALQRGDNAIAAVLTDGWFSGYVSPMQSRDQFGTTPRLRAELQIEFVDGAKMLVLSDAEWKAATGALQQADPTLGERYDARAELLKWNTPDFDASLWAPVITGAKETAPPSKDSLQADPIPFAELPSRSTKQVGEKTWIFDLGQPLKGTYQLSVQEAAGTVVRLRFAKSLNAAGGVESPLQRTDFTEDTYICNGAEKESFSPRFSIRHYRFVEISGLSKQPTEETFFGIALTNVPVGEDLTEEAKILP
jgi:alpha-L-rhamnosidase